MNILFKDIIIPLLTLVVGGIVTWAGWIMKGGRRREGLETRGIEYDNVIKINKYLVEENDLLRSRYTSIEAECEKQDVLIKQKKELIATLEEEIRMLKVQRTLWKTLNA